jgi:hypothetical protein
MHPRWTVLSPPLPGSPPTLGSIGTAALPGTSENRSPPPLSVGWGRTAYTFLFTASDTAHSGGLASGERKVYLHLRFDLNWLAVQQVGLVLPLLDGFDRRRSEHGVSTDEAQVLD